LSVRRVAEPSPAVGAPEPLGEVADDEVAFGEFDRNLAKGAVDGFGGAAEVVDDIRRIGLDAVVPLLEGMRVAEAFSLFAVLGELPVPGVLCVIARREIHPSR
jgi:hypothetical protein